MCIQNFDGVVCQKVTAEEMRETLVRFRDRWKCSRIVSNGGLWHYRSVDIALVK
jgi:hypothetical protein